MRGRRKWRREGPELSWSLKLKLKRVREVQAQPPPPPPPKSKLLSTQTRLDPSCQTHAERPARRRRCRVGSCPGSEAAWEEEEPQQHESEVRSQRVEQWGASESAATEGKGSCQRINGQGRLHSEHSGRGSGESTSKGGCQMRTYSAANSSVLLKAL